VTKPDANDREVGHFRTSDKRYGEDSDLLPRCEHAQVCRDSKKGVSMYLMLDGSPRCRKDAYSNNRDKYTDPER
jgi:hypothetical protein